MKPFKATIVFGILAVVAFSCSATEYAIPVAAIPWTHAYDFDGDGNNDVIGVKFTGGAHCCYKISVTLSSNGITQDFPFQLDGGYIGGLNLSQPQRFTINKTGQALPEIVMEIETYNGKRESLPAAWKKKYGFKTHYIAISFPAGKPHIKDQQRRH